MAVEKISISFDPETIARARRAAAREKVPLSTWIGWAAKEAADLAEARAALAEHFAEYGEPTAEARAEARRMLDSTGVGRPVPPEEHAINQAAMAELDRRAGNDPDRRRPR